VYQLQNHTVAIVEKLQSLLPGRKLNEYFIQIVAEGTGKAFSPQHNQIWLETTRPIVEAFFHARYFLQMAVKYGRELEYPPRVMPSGWAALLYEDRFGEPPKPTRGPRVLPREDNASTQRGGYSITSSRRWSCRGLVSPGSSSYSR